MPDASDPTAIHFLRPGTYTDSRGTEVTFTSADLQEMAAVYDPALHEAPVVIGHPADDAPAYGWVKQIVTDDDGATALAGDIDPQFAELCRQGRFRKVSAAIYLPQSAGHPKPGSYYLRHVGVLGAAPPAIKGLRQTQFADGDGYVTLALAEVSSFTLASLFRGLRDFMIEQFGGDKADRALPGYLVDSLRDDLMAPPPASDAATAEYAEAMQNSRATKNGGQRERRDAPDVDPAAAETAATLSDANIDDGDAMSEDNAAKAAELAEREAALAELEAAFAERRRRDEAERVIDRLNKDGVRVLPADRAAMACFVASLDDASAVAFGEGDAGMATPCVWFQSWLARLPVQVDLSERAADADAAIDADDAESIARAAQHYQAAEAQAGRTVRIDDAVRHVTSQA